MHRRTILAAAGSGLLAGCLSSSSSDDAPPTDDAGTTNGSPSRTERSGDTFTVADFEVSTTKTAPTARYYLRITHTYSTDAVEREDGDQTIRDVSEIEDPALRAAIEGVLSDGKLWREEIPEGLRALTERVDFFTWDANTDPEDTATHWRIAVYDAWPGRDPVVEFDAELVDEHVAPGDPGEIAFSLTNTSGEPQTVFSGTVPPFSILWAEASGDDTAALLWRNYTAEGCVGFDDHGGEATMYTCDIGVNTTIDPNETIEKRYELRSGFGRDALDGDGFAAADHYTVAETLSYHRGADSQGPSTRVDWTVEFDLETL